MVTITGKKTSSASFTIHCTDPARGSVESDCFQSSDWTVEDAVETYCGEYGLTNDQIAVEWNEDADSVDIGSLAPAVQEILHDQNALNRSLNDD